MNRYALVVCTLTLVLCLAPRVDAAKLDVDYERLSGSLSQLESDSRLGSYAASEIASARAALTSLEENGRGKKRAHLLYMAERRVDIAWAAAQLLDLENQQKQLQQEHNRLQLAAARHEAEQARRELDQQRMMAQIRAEEAERQAAEALALGEQETAAAREEADQARRLADAQAKETALARKEAELAGAAAVALRSRLNALRETRGAQGMQMSLDDVAFATGQSSLRAEAGESLAKLAEFVRKDPDKRVRIEGHTDSTGSANANQVLSQKRAEAVRDALERAGIDASRMTAVGVGEERPVASNETAEGRAKNRRVDIILLEKQ
jgi:outer membrane protein OmpA-like peptidoglycan-associated protein